jgi:hypothetical protein
MKKRRFPTRRHPRRFGPIHVSACMPAALVAFYQALKATDPDLAEAFRADPFGLKHEPGRPA